MQQNPSMGDAMLKALMAQVFGPGGGTGTPAQQQAGGNGHLGAAAGMPQGYIGASVPQAQQAPPGGAQAPKPAQGLQTPASGQQRPQNGGSAPGGGLAALLPLLVMAAPLVLRVLAPMLQGAAAPQRPPGAAP